MGHIMTMLNLSYWRPQMKHNKYEEIKILLLNNINVLVSGPAASGKSTVIIEACKELGYTLQFISCSQQMTVSHLLGFMSVDGTYIRTQFRNAIEYGYTFLLDEIDAASPNTLLVLNAVESGLVSFPDGVIEIHPNFRLCATANTIDSDNHSSYTGRNNLDEATLSRFDIIKFELDTNLEQSLVSKPVYHIVNLSRGILEKYNDPKVISMRDTIRYEKRAQIGLADRYYEKLLGYNTSYIEDLEIALKQKAPEEPSSETKVRVTNMKQSEANTLDELWEIIQNEATQSSSENITREEALEIARSIYGGAVIHDWVLHTNAPTSEDPYGKGYVLKSSNQVFEFNSDESDGIEIQF